MAFADYIGHCNLFYTIAEGFRTPSPFSGMGRISNYWCPVNVFKSFKIQYLSNYKPQFIIKTNLSQ